MRRILHQKKEYRIEWKRHYKEIKSSPTVKFEPNFVGINLKVFSFFFLFLSNLSSRVSFEGINTLGVTKKDSLHVLTVPY